MLTVSIKDMKLYLSFLGYSKGVNSLRLTQHYMSHSDYGIVSKAGIKLCSNSRLTIFPKSQNGTLPASLFLPATHTSIHPSLLSSTFTCLQPLVSVEQAGECACEGWRGMAHHRVGGVRNETNSLISPNRRNM